MKRFVLDASVALRWFLDDPVSPYANRVKQFLIKGGRAVVPALWHLEILEPVICYILACAGQM